MTYEDSVSRDVVVDAGAATGENPGGGKENGVKFWALTYGCCMGTCIPLLL